MHESATRRLLAISRHEDFLDQVTRALPAAPPHEWQTTASRTRPDGAIHLIERAIDAGRPFSVAVVELGARRDDAGIEQVRALWRRDPDLQVIGWAHESWQHEVINDTRLVVLGGPLQPAAIATLAGALADKRIWIERSRADASCRAQAEARAAEFERTVHRLRAANEKLLAENEERRIAEERFRHNSLHDNLTGLPNRALLLERLDRALERCKRSRDFHFAVLFIDLDNFKTINDSIGHAAGDSVLVEVSRRFTATLRGLDTPSRPADDTTARLGGDEFVILLDGLRAPSDAEIVAERVLRALRPTFRFGGKDLALAATIGIAHGDPDCDSGADILRNADIALYEAKEAGKSTVRVFSRGMRDHVASRNDFATDLRLAVDRRQVRLLYQPIVCLDSGAIAGFESLARWEHPTRGPIPPTDFIPVAEELGVIETIGEWVLAAACAQMQAWRTSIPGAESLSVSVNVSPIQLRSRKFRDVVQAALDQSGLPARALILEVTETSCLEADRGCDPTLRALRDMGVRIYIDDFGAGFSTLNCLRALHLDGVKIDRAFVKELEGQVRGTAIVEVMRSIAGLSNKVVVAEGIETIEQLVQLQALGCEFGQGYFLSRPLEPGPAEEFLRKEQHSPVLAEVLAAAQRSGNQAA